MSSFYTRSGDDGYTGILGEGRITKYDPRMEAVGDLDESTAILGYAKNICKTSQTRSLIEAIQRDLYHIMAEVSATPENASRFRKIGPGNISWIEEKISTIESQVQMPNEFILPGDSLAGAELSVARTVVRRTERRIAYLIHQNQLENKDILRYLNRLSSLCFILELLENQAAGSSSPTLAKDTP